MTCSHVATTVPNNRGSCVKCGQVMPAETPRDVDLEREIHARAAENARWATGVLDIDSAGLQRMAEGRALPGGLRPGIDWGGEAREEAADLRNYLVWEIAEHWDAYMADDPEAGDLVAKRLSALARLLALWDELA